MAGVPPNAMYPKVEEIKRVVDSRNVAEVSRFIRGLAADSEEMKAALDHAISNYLGDISRFSIGEEDYYKKTLEIIKLLMDQNVPATSDWNWNNIQFQSAMNPYVSSHKRKVVPLIFVLSINLNKKTDLHLFDMVRSIAEEYMTNEEIEEVLANPSSLALMPGFADLLPESLKNAFSRRKHAVATYAVTPRNNMAGGFRRRRGTHRRRFSKKRKTTRVRR